MLKNIRTFSLLSVVSFCFFTLVFHAVAYTQESVIVDVSRIAGSQNVTLESLPTPTIYIAQSMILPETTDVLTITSPLLSPTIMPEKLIEPNVTPVPEIIKITSTPTLTPAIMPDPTTMPTPTAIESPVNVEMALSTNGGMDAEKLFSMANAHRASIGVPALQKDEKTCSLAVARASEIAGEMAAGTLHSGMYDRRLPYWNTENAIAMGPEEVAFGWWLGDGIHRRAIENPGHTVSCVACTGVYCVQEFTSYIPK